MASIRGGLLGGKKSTPGAGKNSGVEIPNDWNVTVTLDSATAVRISAKLRPNFAQISAPGRPDLVLLVP